MVKERNASNLTCALPYHSLRLMTQGVSCEVTNGQIIDALSHEAWQGSELLHVDSLSIRFYIADSLSTMNLISLFLAARNCENPLVFTRSTLT